MPAKRTIVITALIFCIGFFAWVKSTDKNYTIASPLGNSFNPQEIVTRRIMEVFGFRSPLDKLLESAIHDRQGSYGIFVKNLKTQETASLNANSKFEVASLYKLWVAGAVYGQLSKGSIKGDEKLASSKYDLYKKMGFDLEKENEEKLKEEKLETTVNDALTRMITVSDNDSAYLLTDRIGFANISNFLEEQGFANSAISNPPIATAEDIGIFFEKLSLGKIVDAQSSDKLTVLLKSQRLNDRLPKYLPQVAVVHKTGELGTLKHDAGIIYAKNPFILVVLTDTNNPAEAAEFTANISKQIYNYFESKP